MKVENNNNISLKFLLKFNSPRFSSNLEYKNQDIFYTKQKKKLLRNSILCSAPLTDSLYKNSVLINKKLSL